MDGETKRAPTPVGVLRGHSAPVNAVSAVSPSAAVSGSADGVVKLWNLRSRRETSSVEAHSKAGVLHVARLDAARMLSHGRDGSVKLWDIETFSADAKPLHDWYCGSFTFTKVATMRWRAGSGSADDELVLSPSANEKDILVYDPRMDSVTPAMFIKLPDSEKKRGMLMSMSLFSTQSSESAADGATSRQAYVAAGWEGGQLTLLDLRSGGKLACEVQVATGTDPLLAFDVSKDGRTAICGSSAEELSAVSIDYTTLTMKATPFFSVNKGGFSYIRIREDQRIFATAGWDQRVRVFHTRKLKPLAILKHHSESVFGVDFTPDDNFLLSASKDHKLALWSVYAPSPSAVHQLLGPGYRP